jgi:apolipoprotein N-acyltransferase
MVQSLARRGVKLVAGTTGAAVSATAGTAVKAIANTNANANASKANTPRSWLLALLAVLAGYAHAVSIAAPWSGQPLWWLQIAALAVLAVLLQRTGSVRHAALLGWLFATSWLVGSTWWLYTSMHTFGGLAAPLAVLAVLGLSGFLALYYAAASAIYKHLSPLTHVNAAQAAIIFAASWLLAELARDSWFTGFPWAAGGYAHVDGWLGSYAAQVGVYGVGFLACLVAHLLTAVVMRQQLKKRVVAVGLVLLVWGGLDKHFIQPSWATQDGGKVSLALLQGNIPQGEKFDNSKGIPVALAWYAQQLASSTATMVVAPETAIPVLPAQLPQGYLSTLNQRFAAGTQAALVGVPLGNFDEGYTNSAIGFKPQQSPVYRYNKHHLVPFGEFIPPLFKWFTQMMNIPLGDFNRGAIGQPSFEWASQRWAPNVCYEDLFGDELAARFVDEATAPTILVNISNIGWFGDSIAIDQHLLISRMRALELGRPMVRATNTGATAIIDHTGRVTHSLPRFTQGVLVGEVEGGTGTTPFAWWAGRFGLWPLWALGLGTLALAALVWRKPQRTAW